MSDEVALDLLWIDEVRRPELARELLTGGIQIDADDHVGAHHSRALHDVESYTSQAKDHDVGASLDFGGVDHRTDASGHAAADVTDLLERCVLADFRDGNFRQHGEVGKG